MKKPLSLKIKELIDAGNYSDAYITATASAEQYPRIRIYQDLLRQCEARLPKEAKSATDKTSISKGPSHKANIDIETFDFHLRKQLDKVRAKEVSPVKAWADISFLAPPHWPKDPRLTRLVAPSEQALKSHFNKPNNGTLILTGDIRGGAGIAALRVFECLNSIGSQTDILYRDDKKLLLRRANESISEIETIDLTETIYSDINYQLIEELRSYINNEVHQTMARKGPGSNTFLFHSEDSIDIKSISQYYSAINIHWCDFLLTATGLERIKESTIPIAITLHDMYWLNGSCHYSAACTQFTGGCTSCPLVTSNSDSIIHFNSYHRYVLKSLKDLVIISPSKWLCELAAKSSALINREIYYIPNPQPTKASKILNSARMQEPDPTLTLIYGALGLEEKRKGYDVFIELNKELLRRQFDIRFKVFGSLTPDQEIELSQYPCDVLGFLSHKELASHFTQSHAMLLLSHEDNYPNLCVEAAAVGLPLIASNNSGLKSLIESSRGGLLTPNDPIEIANKIQSLSGHDIDKLGDNISRWHAQMYDDTKLEQAYKEVIRRSDDRKEFLYEDEVLNLGHQLETRGRSVSNCKHILNLSEYAVEIFVPQGEFGDNTFSLSYSLKNSSTPLDVYIDGQEHETHARLNSDGITYIIEELPTEKVIKLIRHDSISRYYYKTLEVSNISTYPCSLNMNSGLIYKNKSGLTISEGDSGFILCDDSLTIEHYEGSDLYWLLSHKRYSLHFYCFSADLSLIPTPAHRDQKILISFIGVHLRHDPLSLVRLEVYTPDEQISLEPVVADYSFSFLLDADSFNQMNAAFLVTAAGEPLDDGREVIGLIKQHKITAK
jgi:glycosyltransferase involved in cell wall biosynthesis